MQLANDPLVFAIEELETALAGSPESWADSDGRFTQILIDVEKALRRHGEMIGRADDQSADMDRALLPCPGVARQHLKMRDELASLLREAHAIRRKLEGNAPVPVLAPEEVGLVCPETPLPDLRQFFSRVRQLCDAMENLHKEEMQLIQDSVTTDIGAGD